MRHCMEWTERIHTNRWYCDANHPEIASVEPLEFDDQASFVAHLENHGTSFTKSQIYGRIRRNRQITTRACLVCQLCDCVPEDVQERISERPYNLLWQHIADHLKSTSFLSLSYVQANLDDVASVTDSSKSARGLRTSLLSSSDSLAARDLEGLDLEFTDDASYFRSFPSQPDDVPLKLVTTDFEHLRIHLAGVKKSLRLDINEVKQREMERKSKEKAWEDRVLSPDSYRVEIALRRLHVSRYEDFKDAIALRAPGTCDWITDHSQFQKWVHDKRVGTLLLNAKPGRGMSVLAKFLIDEVLQNTEERTTCYFFFDHERRNKRSGSYALCAVLHQLFRARSYLLKDWIINRLEQMDDPLITGIDEL